MKNTFILIAMFVFGIVVNFCENLSEPNINENTFKNELIKSVGKYIAFDTSNWRSKQIQVNENRVVKTFLNSRQQELE